MSDTLTAEEEAARQERTRDAMKADGVTVEERVQVDYFGFSEQEKVMLPDGVSFVLIAALNEGGRRNYLDKVNREVVITKGTGDARMQMANGTERLILLRHAMVGWNLKARDRVGDLVDVPFREPKVNDFLEKASPTIIDIIDKAVRKQNPWLMQDVTLDDLLKQRDELDEQIEKKRQEDEGKES